MAYRKSIRWGLLGTARINDRFLEAVRESKRSSVVAVASRSLDRAAMYAESRGIPNALGSYQELVEESGLDAVYVSLPNHLHAAWSIRAMERGKHVLCEKPLALRIADVDQAINVATRCGVVYQEALVTRFHPQTVEVSRVIASGEIGELLYARAEFTFRLPSMDDIRMDATMGGGSLWDLGCYPVSFFQAVLREDPVAVTACAQLEPSGVDGTFCAQLHYQSGLGIHIMTSMCSPASRTAVLIGTQGRIQLHSPWLTDPGVPARGVLSLATEGAVQATFGDVVNSALNKDLDFESESPYLLELRGFESSVLDGAVSPYPPEDSRRTVAVLSALLEAAESGQRVALRQGH